MSLEQQDQEIPAVKAEDKDDNEDVEMPVNDNAMASNQDSKIVLKTEDEENSGTILKTIPQHKAPQKPSVFLVKLCGMMFKANSLAVFKRSLMWNTEPETGPLLPLPVVEFVSNRPNRPEAIKINGKYPLIPYLHLGRTKFFKMDAFLFLPMLTTALCNENNNPGRISDLILKQWVEAILVPMLMMEQFRAATGRGSCNTMAKKWYDIERLAEDVPGFEHMFVFGFQPEYPSLIWPSSTCTAAKLKFLAYADKHVDRAEMAREGTGVCFAGRWEVKELPGK